MTKIILAAIATFLIVGPIAAEAQITKAPSCHYNSSKKQPKWICG